MKTAIRIMAAGLAASLALVSCAKQDAMDNGSTSPAGGARTIAVSFANASVKSSLGEDGLTPKFVATDVIKVSNGSATEDCTVEIDGSGNASITTELTGALTMVYPAAAAKMNGNAIEGVLVPTVQDGTFASANICKATIAEKATEASFENQTAIFKLPVPAKDDEKGVDYVVKSLAVKSIGENNIAEGSKEIKVGDGTSTIAAENGFYYVSVLPGETSSNLYVCAGAGARKLTGADAIAKNKIYSVALPVLNGHEYVEITMTVGETTKTYKWATMNVGATTVTGTTSYGKLYSWGNIDGQSGDSFDPAFTNANYKNTEGYKINNTDYLWDKTKHDAAYNEWGGAWRMPTGGSAGEFAALKAATYWKWEDEGYYVYTPNPATDAGKINSNGTGTYSKSNALLFFPAAGRATGASRYNAGSFGIYCSSTWFGSSFAYYLFVGSSGVIPECYDTRYDGFSVRPVSD